MRLHVKNIGILNDAEIEIAGITVVAGENNTGKSTFGKALYAVFSGLHQLEKRVENAKRIGAMRAASGAFVKIKSLSSIDWFESICRKMGATKLTESFFIRNTPETNAEKECFPKLLSVLFGRTCHVVFLCVSFPETAYSLLLRERRAHSFRPKDLTFSLIYRAYTTSIPFVFSFPVSSALFQPGLLSRSGKNTEACPTASAKVTKASLQ